MKSCYLVAPGRLEMREVPRPIPTDGELVIKIKTALTCGTDLKAFRRGHPKMPMPTPFGHEFSGEIVETRGEVNGFREGDAVMGVHTAPCGNCYYCRRGQENMCHDTMKNMTLGAYSEYIKIPRRIVQYNLFKKPAYLNFEEAAMLEPLACVVHGIDPLNLQAEDTVLIIGDGAIGLLHLLMARTRGVENIFIAGKHSNRLKLAHQLGASYTIDVGKEDPAQTVLDMTKGFGANWVFECTGRPRVWQSTLDPVAKGGTVVLFGGCPAGTTVDFDTARLHYDEISLVGSFHFTPGDVEKAYKILVERKIDVRSLITDCFPLQKLDQAFNLLLQGNGIKYAILP